MNHNRIFIGITLSISVFVSGCYGIPFYKVSSPKPGLVLVVNRNEWAQGEVMIFHPGVRHSNFVQMSQNGRLTITRRPLARIRLDAAPATSISALASVELNPRQCYSIIILWTNKVGQFLNFTYGSVCTSEECRETYVDFIGQRIIADRVYYAPMVNAYDAKPCKVEFRGF